MSNILLEDDELMDDAINFDDIERNIVSGVPVRLKKVVYTGHASSIYSVDNAVEILDFISEKTDSEDVLPFALRLVENGEVIQIAEDNGEVACGELLSTVLNGYEGYNVLVCVSRQVEGCYVSEMVQHFKLRCVKEAATSALDNIFLQFNPRSASSESKEGASRAESKSPERMPPPERKFGPKDYVVSKRVQALKREIEKAQVYIDPFVAPSDTTHLKLKRTRGKLVKLSQKLATAKLA